MSTVLLTWSKFQTCLLKKPLEAQKKLKELVIMRLNTVYICISWYNKICWFSVKKCWCQQKSEGVIFFRSGITVPSFNIVGYVWQILGKGAFLAPLRPWAAPKCPSWIGLRHIQDQLDIFSTLCNPRVFIQNLTIFWAQAYLQLWNVNQAYSESCHGVLFSHIQTYSEPCATLTYTDT